MLTMQDDPTRDSRPLAPVAYDSTPPTPLRTIDRPIVDRAPTPEALAVLRALVQQMDEAHMPSEMPAPHAGPRFSQRRAARKLLAGRSYQALQAWLSGEPVPYATAEFLLRDLQRIDAREEGRMVRVEDDEIAIIVRR
jgi:hypothetical protein